MEDEWLVFEEFLYSEVLEDLRSSFSQAEETNAEHKALDNVERWNDTTRETKTDSRLTAPIQSPEMVLDQIGQKLSAAVPEVVQTFLNWFQVISRLSYFNLFTFLRLLDFIFWCLVRVLVY